MAAVASRDVCCGRLVEQRKARLDTQAKGLADLPLLSGQVSVGGRQPPVHGRLLVGSFILMDPWWTLRLGAYRSGRSSTPRPQPRLSSVISMTPHRRRRRGPWAGGLMAGDPIELARGPR
jgi:hypothetical protein